VRGLSALARDPDGTLWSIPERQDVLVRLALQGPSLQLETLPLLGKPVRTDAEGLAIWRARAGGPLQFAIGTEAHGGSRPRDAVLLGSLRDGAAVVERTVWLDYGAWQLQAEDNRGLEGTCWAESLWVVSETAVEAGGVRWSPLARLGADGQWTTGRLGLTSRQGRFSALACRAVAPDRVELWAIERQFGVSRWVRAVVPAAGPDGQVVQPEVLADLAPPAFAVWGTVPNFEGIASDPLDLQTAWVVADNDRGGMQQGPLVLAQLRPLRLPSAPACAVPDVAVPAAATPVTR
jgi:hypothetical protein